LCKVLSQSVKGFGFCEGSKFDHSHWIAMSPLTQGGLPPACDHSVNSSSHSVNGDIAFQWE